MEICLPSLLGNSGLAHRNDFIFPGSDANLGRPPLAGFLSHQLFTEWRLRRNHRYLLTSKLDLQASVRWSNEECGPGAIQTQFHQGGEIDRFVRRKTLRTERL